jgi:purine nucleosidase
MLRNVFRQKERHHMPPIYLIDTDTASDDAIALVMAIRNPDVKVAAITTVSGNVDVEQATRNALYVVELCGQMTPVHIGATKPLVRPNAYMTLYHGTDGLGDNGFVARHLTAASEGAVDTIIATASSNPGLTIVALGPLTNIANALLRKPRIVDQIGRCIVMGGAPCGGGNITPAAEYNFWVDPDAAKIVLNSRLPIELIGLHLCRGEAVLNSDEIKQIEALPGPYGNFAVACSRYARQYFFARNSQEGLSLPDPLAMAIALDRSIAKQWGEHYADVEVESELTRGASIVDRNDVAGDEYNAQTWRRVLDVGSRIKVCWKISPLLWKKALLSALS